MLLHHHFFATNDIDALLRLVDSFAVKGKYRGIVLSITHYLVNARYVYFYDFLEFLPNVSSLIGILASFRYIQCGFLSACEYILANSNWSRV